MSKKRAIQRAIEKQNGHVPGALSPTRPPFTITLMFDPQRPTNVTMNIMPLGGGENGAKIDDVVTATRLAYEEALLQKGAFLFQKQLQQAMPAQPTPAEANAPSEQSPTANEGTVAESAKSARTVDAPTETVLAEEADVAQRAAWNARSLNSE